MFKNLILAGLLFFPGIAFAECGGYWEVSALTNRAGQYQNLTLNGRTAKTIPTAWFQKLTSIKQKIDATSGIYTKLLLCSSREVNAFASSASGANVVVLTFGMYGLIGNDWDVYASLLGHENAHLVHGHGQLQKTRDALIGFLGVLAGAVLDAAIENETGVKGIGFGVANITSDAVSAGYSRGDELEADRSGMIYAHRSGFDPNGALRLHHKMSKASDFFSTHPSSQERISVLRTEIALLTTRPQPDNVQVVATDGWRNASIKKPISPPTSANSASSTSIVRDTGAKRGPGSGVVLKVKSRYRYLIASQTDFNMPTKGMTVIVNAGGRNISGTVERVIDGYFSVLVDVAIDDTLIGRRINFQ
jgi:hypothetical protein